MEHFNIFCFISFKTPRRVSHIKSENSIAEYQTKKGLASHANNLYLRVRSINVESGSSNSVPLQHSTVFIQFHRKFNSLKRESILNKLEMKVGLLHTGLDLVFIYNNFSYLRFSVCFQIILLNKMQSISILFL